MGLNLEQNARLFALLNLAEADTGIASWDAKVYFDNWRPMLAINTADTDGNPDTLVDAAWTPLIPTPSFGSYTSGHSAFSMAGASVLAAFFGTDNMSFTVDSESPFLPVGYTRSFNSFSEAAEEAGMSRIYGGIHPAYDDFPGRLLGQQVGGAQKHRSTLVERQRRPIGCRGQRRVDGLLGIGVRCLLHDAEHGAVVGRHAHLVAVGPRARTALCPEGAGQLGGLGGSRGHQSRLDLSPLRAAGGVVEDGFVLGCRNGEGGVAHGVGAVVRC